MAHTSYLSPFVSPIAWIIYLWMGFAFVTCTVFAVSDGFLIILKFVGKRGWFDGSLSILRSSYSVIAVIALSAVITLYGICAARHVPATFVTILTHKVDALSRPVRIVQISDVHLGLTSRDAWMNRLVETIRNLKPDMIVSTGDLVDAQLHHVTRFADMFAGLHPRLGKFAVMGNHEVYAGMHRDMSFFRRGGFIMLSNEGVNTDSGIAVIGVDDPAVSQRLKTETPNEASILEHFSQKYFVVLLKHQPVVETSSIPFIDLQLSGHSHGGQIFPFRLITRLIYPASLGLSKVGHNTWFYHSRGTGTWGPPMRVLASPEITVIDLKPSSARREKGD
jgi:predicted MPP superfamily phosphohydrolase